MSDKIICEKQEHLQLKVDKIKSSMARKSTKRKPQKRKGSNYFARFVWSFIGVAFAVLTVFNLSSILWGDESLFFRIKLKKEITRMEESISELKKQNVLMRTRIYLLKNDPQIIEEEARRRLNLVKEGEELFIFPSKE